jgi:hypothetical protein
MSAVPTQFLRDGGSQARRPKLARRSIASSHRKRRSGTRYSKSALLSASNILL